jgi:hypothetical protein
MPPLQALNMFDIRFSGDGEACSFKPTNTELNSIERYDFRCLLTNVINETRKAKDSVRNFGLELSSSPKDHHRFDGFGRQKVEHLLYSANMPRILENWILKPELPSIQNLRPLGLRRIRKDPTSVILRLDDEDAKSRNKNMINLRGAIT